MNNNTVSGPPSNEATPQASYALPPNFESMMGTTMTSRVQVAASVVEGGGMAMAIPSSVASAPTAADPKTQKTHHQHLDEKTTRSNAPGDDGGGSGFHIHHAPARVRTGQTVGDGADGRSDEFESSRQSNSERQQQQHQPPQQEQQQQQQQQQPLGISPTNIRLIESLMKEEIHVGRGGDARESLHDADVNTHVSPFNDRSWDTVNSTSSPSFRRRGSRSQNAPPPAHWARATNDDIDLDTELRKEAATNHRGKIFLLSRSVGKNNRMTEIVSSSNSSFHNDASYLSLSPPPQVGGGGGGGGGTGHDMRFGGATHPGPSGDTGNAEDDADMAAMRNGWQLPGTLSKSAATSVDGVPGMFPPHHRVPGPRNSSEHAPSRHSSQ